MDLAADSPEARARHLQILNGFARSLLEGGEIGDILWDVCNRVVAGLGLEDCVIYVVDGARGVLVQRAAYGPKKLRDREIRVPIEIPIGQGIVGSVALHGRPEMVADTRLDPRYLLDDAMRLSELTVPILHDDRVVGVIDSEHSVAGFFGGYHLEVLETVASMAAARIARSLLEDGLRAANQALAHRIEDGERMRAALAASLAEKELLLREVHHRVKNNLQIVSSLLMLQIDRIEDPDVRRMLEENVQRVRAMALIHRQMYAGDSLSAIDFGAYVRQLAVALVAAMAPDTRLPVDADAVEVAGDHAVPLGIILNELITNAIKHGRKGGAGEAACIEVGVRAAGARALLTVRDHGPGIRPGVDPRRSDSLGLTLVETLSRQLRARLDYAGDGGTRVSLDFPVRPDAT